MTAAEATELSALRASYQGILDAKNGMCMLQAAGMKRLIELERLDAAPQVDILSCDCCGDPVTTARTITYEQADGTISSCCKGCGEAKPINY